MGSVQYFILMYSAYGVIQDSQHQCGKLLRKPSSSFGKLLDRVIFIILPNINNGASLQKYVECLKMIGLVGVVLMVFFTCGKLVLVFWFF